MGDTITHSNVWMFWFAGALFFFFAAMLRPEQASLYIPVGIVFLILAINPIHNRET